MVIPYRVMRTQARPLKEVIVLPRVYIDASSAILLYRAGLFERAARFFSLVLAPTVFRELDRNTYPGARLFRKMAQSGQIRVSRQKPDLADIKPEDNRVLDNCFLEGLRAMDTGEQETIGLYLSSQNTTHHFILMDDGQGARFCARHGIPFINALLVPKIFWYSGLMDQQTAEGLIERLTELGRYSKGIITKAGQLGREDLAFFTDRENRRG